MKKSYIYAHLDENNICFAVTVHPSPMKGTQLVELTEKDDSLLRKKYVSGEWMEVPTTPPEPQPTQLDRIEAKVNELGAESLPISKVETAIMEGVNGI